MCFMIVALQFWQRKAVSQIQITHYLAVILLEFENIRILYFFQYPELIVALLLRSIDFLQN